MENEIKTSADLFLQELRVATGPMHKALEGNRISQILMSSSVSIPDYAFYLKCMEGVMKSYDSIVLPVLSTVLKDYESRKKVIGISQDLEFLYANGVEEKMAKPFIGFSGNLDIPYALGCAYVIEGSTLGGRVILKHIGQVLGLGELGTKFFTGYGPETGRFWKGFLEVFTAYILENKVQNEAIRGAIDSFSHIEQHLSQNS